MRVPSRSRSTISGAWLVRILASHGDSHACTGCGSRMFVQTRDGCCPVCRRQNATREDEIERIAEAQAREVVSDWQ